MIKEHKIYWIGFISFLLCSVIVLLFTDKGDTLLYFNHFRTSTTVIFFRFMSYIVEYPVFIILFVVYLFKSYRTSILIGLSGIIALTVVAGLKWFFGKPRPGQFYSEIDFHSIVQFLENYTPLIGYTSFPSGHTTAAFVIFTSLAIAVKRRWADCLFLSLAILAGISRVFLANHFLEDIVAGSILGVVITILVDAVLTKLKVQHNISIKA